MNLLGCAQCWLAEAQECGMLQHVAERKPGGVHTIVLRERSAFGGRVGNPRVATGHRLKKYCAMIG